jgi:hypothetical protein
MYYVRKNPVQGYFLQQRGFDEVKVLEEAKPG